MKPVKILKTLLPLSILLITPCAFAVGMGGNAVPAITSQTATTIAPVDVTYPLQADWHYGVNTNRTGCGGWGGAVLTLLSNYTSSYVLLASPTNDFVVPATGTYYLSMDVQTENCNGGSGEWNVISFWPRLSSGNFPTKQPYTDYGGCQMLVEMWGGGSCGFGGGAFYENNTFGTGNGSNGGTICTLGVLTKGQHVSLVGQITQSGTGGPCVAVTGGFVRFTSTN